MPATEPVVGQGVAEVDVVDVLALDDHVGLAQRIRARIDVLSVEHRAGLRVHLHQVVVGRRQHAPGSGSRIVDSANGAGFGQRVVLSHEQNVDHQLNDFTWSEMITRLGGVGFCELADEFFEDVPHVVAGDDLRMQVDGGELSDDEVQPVRLGEVGNLIHHPEPVEHVTHIG
jgi:hypothetical protein